MSSSTSRRFALIAALAASCARAGDPAALQRAVAAAVAAGERQLVVAPGTYNFSSLPPGAPATLAISSASNFTLSSGGGYVELIFPPSGGLRVTSSADVALLGPFVFDAWPPFTTQGVVSDGRREGRWLNFSLKLNVDAGYEVGSDVARFLPSRALFFDAASRRTLPDQVEVVNSALSITPIGDGGVWAVSVSFSGDPSMSVPDGALCSLTPVVGGPVLQVTDSARFVARDITSFGASGFTFLELGGDGGHEYTRLNVTRRPGSSRLMASAADVFHSTAVAAGPLLADSELSFAGDDLFAVHCELGILWRRVNSTAVYVIDTGAGVGLAQGLPGDALYFFGLNEDMPLIATAALGIEGLVPVTNATLIAEAERAGEYIRDVLHVVMRNFTVNLLLADIAPPGLPPALSDFSALVELPSRCGAGATVRNSYLHDTAGGMRLKGSRVTVVNSVLENAYGMRMLPELFWTQSVSSNITLANNVLRGCGCTALAPHAIEYNPDIVGLRLLNNSVIPEECRLGLPAATAAALAGAGAGAGAGAVDFFVSPSGDDSAGGTSPAAAWRTPGRAAAALSARARPLTGDATVHLAAGLYLLDAPLVLDATTGGDAETTVTWDGGSGSGGLAVLSGAAPIAGPWVASAATRGVFTAALPPRAPGAPMVGFVRRLYCGDDACAATGNASLGPVRALASTPVLTHAGVNANLSLLVAAAGDLDGVAPAAFADAQLVLWHAWATSVNAVAAWLPANRTLFARGALGDHFNPLAYAQSLDRYAIHNLQSPSALEPGRFFFNSSARTVSYAALAGEAPGAFAAGALLAESLPVVLDVAGASRVTFSGALSVRHGAADLESRCLSGGCGAQSGVDMPTAAVMVRAASSDVSFVGVELAFTSGWGATVESGAERVAFEGCHVHDVGIGGVRAGSTGGDGVVGFRVADCTIERGGSVLPAAPGILLQTGRDASISHNEVRGFVNTGIATGWTWGFKPTQNSNISVDHNLVHHLGVELPLAAGVPPALTPAASGNVRTSDMGCIYNLGVSPNLSIDHNVCHDTRAATYGAWGVYLDEGSSDAAVTSNVVFSTYSAGLHLHYGANLSVTNNVLALNVAFPCNSTGGTYCDTTSFLADPDSSVERAQNVSFARNIVLLGPSPNATAVVVRFADAFNMSYEANVYWSTTNDTLASRPLFNARNFSAWRADGFDARSVLADPQFVDAPGLDFSRLQPTSPAIALGFVPIDTSGVGPRAPWAQRRKNV